MVPEVNSNSQQRPEHRASRILSIDSLILIPTTFESDLIESQLADYLGANNVAIIHCGFGPVAAAAVATEAVINHRPKRVILLGIAGAYLSTENNLTVGHAYRFGTVTVDGIGVGAGNAFQSAHDLGWSQFAGDQHRRPINDTIELGTDSSDRLLTVCAASATPAQADLRQQRYGAAAEDMEGFAVAMACRLQDVPLEIIRGISNVAGDRDKSNWRIKDALNSAAVELGVALQEKA